MLLKVIIYAVIHVYINLQNLSIAYSKDLLKSIILVWKCRYICHKQ